ncbi:MAG: sodium-dependent transporter [Haloarculaceae archaeon]
MSDRETWASRVGFVLAAVGSAVGLGNVWRFPYMTAANGGAAFLVVYLLAALLIGLPAMLAEFVIGRRAKRNVIDAFDAIGYPAWRVIGLLGLVTGFWLLSYYSVVGGWVLRYTVGSATGAYFGDPKAYFDAIATGGGAVAFHGLFMLLTVVVVALGVEGGIELATKVMVPAILLVLVGLAAWGATLPGAGAGLAYFLDPNFDALAANYASIVPAALGQAFFSLSLGMGVMITYSSYIREDDNLGVDGGIIVLLNTAVGVLAGLVAFPLLFSQNVAPGSAGAGAIFVSMATAFAKLPAGRVVGVIFFGVVLIAALSSAISLLEVVVSYVVDNYRFGRAPTAVALGAAIFVLGVPSATNLSTFTLFDQVASNLLLPLGVLLIVTFVGWVYGRSAVDELRQGADRFATAGPAWLWHVRVIVLLAIVAVFLFSVSNLLETYVGVALFG